MRKPFKIALRIVAAVWLGGYLFMLAGCGDFNGVFTTPVIYELSEVASPMNEFVKYDTPMHKCVFHEGLFTGTFERRGKTWNRYHFSGLLNPKDRILEITVQDSTDGEVVVGETKKVVAGKEPAFLIDHCFCGECVPKMAHKKNYLYTNALGSDDFICSPPKRLYGTVYSGGFVTARISLSWVQRSRVAQWAKLAKLLYTVPLDIVALPVQPVFYAVYQI